jgi:branched-chain amino acid transport system ATP-binding protein
MAEGILETVDLARHFAGLWAVAGVSVKIGAGEVVGIVGPNGSGKTTFLNLVTGYLKPSRGRVLYRGRDITGLGPRRVTRLGVARSFQIPQLYIGMTVLENMLVALAVRDGEELKFWGRLKRPDRVREAREALDRFGLGRLSELKVSALGGGERKLLDVALAFALGPELLLLDEPTSGVSTSERYGIMETILGAVGDGRTAVVFIEHDLEVVRRYARRVLVFLEGRVVADGPPDEALSARGMGR